MILGFSAKTGVEPLAQGVGHSTNMIWHKADKKHNQQAENTLVRLAACFAAAPLYSLVGLVHLPGYGRVAERHEHKCHPEDGHNRVDRGFMPAAPKFALQVHA